MAKTSGLLPYRYRSLSEQMKFLRKVVFEKLSYFTVALDISYIAYRSTRFVRSSSYARDALFPIHVRPTEALSITVMLDTHHLNAFYSQEICIRASYWSNICSWIISQHSLIGLAEACSCNTPTLLVTSVIKAAHKKL